jgi:ribonuclease J
MQARIVRGADQVGGSCVELKCDASRLVLDVGLPLSRAERYRDLIPDVPGLWASGDGSLRGVLLSHSHPDHCGLADLVSSNIPVLCGRDAQAVWNAAAFFVPGLTPFAASAHLEHGVPLRLGPFLITAWLVDHSAYGAYSISVRAAGRHLLYSGDIRATGRKDGALEKIARSVGRVDTVLMEGTRIVAQPNELTERDVENEAVDLLRATSGLGLAFFSPMNIDRLVSLYRAARRANREFVMDLYTATVARATANPSVPQSTWDGVRVDLPNSQRRRVIESRDFSRLDAVRAARIFADEIESRGRDLVIACRASMIRELHGCLASATAIWSMWSGYLDRDRNRELVGILGRYGVPVHRLHASGHGSRETLQSFARTLRPGCVVPIHTERPEAFRDVFDEVVIHPDGEWWTV